MSRVLTLIFSFFGLLIGISASAQKLTPYIAPGISVSSGLPSFALEGGVFDDKVWYGITVEATPDAADKSQLNFAAGPKFYYKLTTVSTFVDVYIYGAAKLGLTKGVPLSFEPGGCLVFNVNKHIGLQWSVSSPVYENSTLFRPLYLSTGLGVNYFF